MGPREALFVKLLWPLVKRRVAAPFYSSFSISLPNVMAIFRRGPPNGAVECRWGKQKRDSRPMSVVTRHRVLSTVQPPSVIHTASPDRGKLVTHVARNKRSRLLFTGDDDKVFMTRSFNVTRRQQNSISMKTARSLRSSTYCAVEANWWQTRSIARPLCEWQQSYLFMIFVALSYARGRHVHSGVSVHLSVRHTLVYWVKTNHGRIIRFSLSASPGTLVFDAPMLCISAAYAVVRCLSVRPSVRPSVGLSVWVSVSHFCVLCQKWVNIFSNFFHHRVTIPSSFSPYQTCMMAILNPRGTHNRGRRMQRIWKNCYF